MPNRSLQNARIFVTNAADLCIPAYAGAVVSSSLTYYLFRPAVDMMVLWVHPVYIDILLRMWHILRNRCGSACGGLTKIGGCCGGSDYQ